MESRRVKRSEKNSIAALEKVGPSRSSLSRKGVERATKGKRAHGRPREIYKQTGPKWESQTQLTTFGGTKRFDHKKGGKG